MHCLFKTYIIIFLLQQLNVFVDQSLTLFKQRLEFHLAEVIVETIFRTVLREYNKRFYIPIVIIINNSIPIIILSIRLESNICYYVFTLGITQFSVNILIIDICHTLMICFIRRIILSIFFYNLL